uniref:Small ribosomal subunit protein uS3c n=1 Tax=Sciadopitys verticillata TaxID=28979 RepID=G3XHJ5_SCIVE|nr:ribosomal protein S3 [Sciadopitys verticillata]AMO00770.1 ribosomal protein S3 [Sciadopitys verticillata]BAK86742.1 ribosomal protein S3 [Sciadopitys verticillata]BAW34553.1 ribosomal protein S3 [Sciadopitys verticillata]BCK60722.1 ribosomal protein S3 [Sciadopitys verticillata]
MGKKINPLSFRLSFNQNHRSVWFEQSNYSENLREDEKIHNCIAIFAKHLKSYSKSAAIVRIEIEKRVSSIEVQLYIGLPHSLIEKQSEDQEIEQFNNDVENMLLPNMLDCVTRHPIIAIEKIAKPYKEPNILAEYISIQLKERIPLNKAVEKALELAEQAGVKGIKINVKGRIGGVERARQESTRQGRLPLQTIQAKFDYCYYVVQTIYGVLGIKIWIFVENEE